jgi:hypothetical protein
MDAILKNALPTARQEGLSLVGRKAKLVGNSVFHLNNAFLPVGGKLKYWQH